MNARKNLLKYRVASETIASRYHCDGAGSMTACDARRAFGRARLKGEPRTACSRNTLMSALGQKRTFGALSGFVTACKSDNQHLIFSALLCCTKGRACFGGTPGSRLRGQ
jgi:hypothetical protein